MPRAGRNSGPDCARRHRGHDRLSKDQVRPGVVDCLAGLVASVTAIAALTAQAVILSGRSGVVRSRLASVIAVLGPAVYDYLLTNSLYSFDICDSQYVTGLGIFCHVACRENAWLGCGERRSESRLHGAKSALLRVAIRALPVARRPGWR